MTALESSEDRAPARPSRMRRTLAPLLAGVLAAVAVNALSACGEAAKPLGLTVTVAQTAPAAPGTAPAATTRPRATRHPHGAAPADSHGAGAGSGSTMSSTTAPRAPASKDTPAIVACLTHAGLVRAGLRNAGLWGGTDPTTGEQVLVDGPYKTRAAADASARSLNGVESAERGGAYVASATLKSHLGTAVHQVAACLDRAGAGGSGSGSSLSF